MNINRDYLIINDVKKSNIKLDNGSMFFYITDKNTQNIFVNLVINVSNNDLIQKYANIENAEDYTLTMNIVKPDNTYKIIEGKLHDKEKAIFEFDLKEDCVDKIGTYKCELLTKCNINNHEEITTSNKLTYKVKSSVLNDLDDIVEAPEYPLVIQLFDKLSDINQYEEDRRANELARQLAEQQRQTRFNELDTDVVDRIASMDDKMADVEDRVSAKEQAVDKLIVDTKKDIDDYKVAKDTEIDEYKTAKDTEINNAIANQDNKIDTAISEQNDRISNAIATQDNKIDTAINAQNDRIAVVENNDVAQDNRLDVLENKDVLHESRLDVIEVKNQQQDSRLDIVENKNTQQDNRLNDIEAKNVEQDNRLNEIEAIDVAQNSRLDAIEVKNQQQDDRLLDAEKVNKRQDMDLKCLFAESKNNMIDVTEEGNSIYLQNSTVGYTLIDEIQGNTMVNCNKEPDKEIILNGNINTQGYSNVTLTEGVDGGLVDVSLEGNTMVNVCDQKDPIAITKNYTVQTGNHVALQGEYDGKCRPVITGKTLVNITSNGIRYSNGTTIEFDNSKSDSQLYSVFRCRASNQGDKIYFREKLTINKNLLTSNSSIMCRIVTMRDGEGHAMLVDNLYNYPVGTYNISAIRTIDSNCVNNSASIQFGKHNSELWETDEVYLSVTIDDTVCYNLTEIFGAGNEPTQEWCDTNLPYIKGMQSSFEDKVVTQEMVDNGEELAENLGKYKVDYVVTGKNKFTGNFYFNNQLICDDYILIKDNTTYFISDDLEYHYTIEFYDKDYSKIETHYPYAGHSFTSPSGSRYLKVRAYPEFTDINVKLQIEEGTEATSYESYKEYKKTFYLNSPLLEGDTIEQQGNNVVHVHRSELRAYQTDDELTLPTDMTNTLVAKATPQYEVISQNDTILCDSYTNGHLDVDSVVPIERVDFQRTPNIPIRYVYPNTEYAIKFESDNVGELEYINCSYSSISNLKVIKGVNIFKLSIGDNASGNSLLLNGIGFNASNIVVTEATNQDFGYFEGMKSVGECEGNVELVSTNSNLLDNLTCLLVGGLPTIKLGETFNDKARPTHSNGRAIVHYPCKPNTTYYLTAKGTKDRANLVGTLNKDKVWVANSALLNYRVMNNVYIITTTSDSSYLEWYLGQNSNDIVHDVILSEYPISANEEYFPPQSNSQQLTHEPLRAVGDIKDKYVLIDGKWYIERNCAEVVLDGSEDWVINNQAGDNKNYYLLYFKPNNILMENCWGNIIADKYFTYNASTSNYWDKSEWIALHGWGYGIGINVLKLKLSTINVPGFKQYLQSNPVTVVYPLQTPTYEPIDYDPFTVYSDTTHISNNSTIPCNMTIKNTGYNCLLKPSTTYTISSNLGLNTVTTPSTLTEDCLRFMDTDTSDVTTMRDVLVLEGDWTSKVDLIPSNFSGIESAFEQEYDEEKGKYKVKIRVQNEDASKENYIEFYINEPLRGIGDIKDKVYVKNDKVVVERNCGQREYQDGDFGTHLTDKVNTVYQLAEPVYEVVEYNDIKLFIESFKNSTLFYNSNVPVTSKVWYSYSVPIVDKVAQTASISDEQDVMIIDLATQVAVMEMMLM